MTSITNSTQTQWIAHLETRLEQQPRNMGIKMNLRDVRAMTPEQWEAHVAKFAARNPERDAAIEKMARKLAR